MFFQINKSISNRPRSNLHLSCCLKSLLTEGQSKKTYIARYIPSCTSPSKLIVLALLSLIRQGTEMGFTRQDMWPYQTWWNTCGGKGEINPSKRWHQVKSELYSITELTWVFLILYFLDCCLRRACTSSSWYFPYTTLASNMVGGNRTNPRS